MAVKSHFSEVQIALLLDNKHEYTEHICDNLSEVLVKTFQEVYEKAYKSPLGRNKGALEAFQLECEGVVSWNAELVSQLFKRIPNPSFSKLLKMVFMTTIKAILAQHGLRLEGRLQVRIPGAEHFVHKCAIEMARSVWKRPYLYYHKVRSLERQRNLHECDLIARKAIRIVLRQSIPMEQILQEIEMANVSEAESQSSEEDVVLSEPEETESEAEEEEAEVKEYEVKEQSDAQSDTESETEAEEVVVKEDEVKEDEVKEQSDVESDAQSDTESETESEAEAEENKVKAQSDEQSDVESDKQSNDAKVEIKLTTETENESDIDASNPSTHNKEQQETQSDTEKENEDEDSDVIHGHSDEDDKTVEWMPRNTIETPEAIQVEKNEELVMTEKPIVESTPTVEVKTTLMGTRHLINPKRIKFVGSGKKDSFFW